jgi:cytoskeletal protein CcmA (bactofilin family)
VKDLLQLKGGSLLDGSIQAAKLQIEPTANFNGECHMTPAAVSAATTGKSSVPEIRREIKNAELAAG